MKKYCFNYILILFFIGVKTTTSATCCLKNFQNTILWKTLTQNNYTIQYPSNWELSQKGEMNTSFFIFSPFDSDKDIFRENVNLLIQDLSGKNIDLNKYVEISEKQIKSLITNSNISESIRLKKNDKQYHKIIYSGEQGAFKLMFIQYYWVIDNKAYVLTFTSKKDTYNSFKETANKILDSFELKEK